MAEHRDINIVLGKPLSVLRKAELPKPIRNLLHWRPPSDFAYPFWTGRSESLAHASTYCSAKRKACMSGQGKPGPQRSPCNVGFAADGGQPAVITRSRFGANNGSRPPSFDS
jgi:hypothetical protein